MEDLKGRRFAVIGAGVAGVAAARGLSARGAEVVIFEKSRGFGGRCASKRWQGHVVDHGAQYFTLRDAGFRALVEAECGGALLRLESPVLDENGSALPDDGRWFHREGNSRVARELAHGLEVRTEQTVADARALLAEFDHVLSTAPWPQTARLFGLDDVQEYIPCLAVLLAYEGEWTGRTREAYAWSAPSQPLAWTACENHKPGRVAAGSTVLVAHMSEAFSREHLERAPEEYPALVRAWVEERWSLPSRAFTSALGHRWRLARPRAGFTLPRLPERLHFVGDASRRARVEDAWLAGQEFACRAEF